jgi:hypothetical protein
VLLCGSVSSSGQPGGDLGTQLLRLDFPGVILAPCFHVWKEEERLAVWKKRKQFTHRAQPSEMESSKSPSEGQAGNWCLYWMEATL